MTYIIDFGGNKPIKQRAFSVSHDMGKLLYADIYLGIGERLAFQSKFERLILANSNG